MSDDDARLIRVRGGPQGYRVVTLGDWKREVKERKGKLPPARSHRQTRQEAKRKRKRS